MGTNLHSAWVDNTTEFKTSDMNFPLAYLDRAITYLKNVAVHHAGVITFSRLTGLLSWSGTIEILFNRSDGIATGNTIAAGSIALSGGQACYVNLSEIDEAVLTMQNADISDGSVSVTLSFNRLILGYRNAGPETSDNFFSAWLFPISGKAVQVL